MAGGDYRLTSMVRYPSYFRCKHGSRSDESQTETRPLVVTAQQQNARELLPLWFLKVGVAAIIWAIERMLAQSQSRNFGALGRLECLPKLYHIDRVCIL